MATTHQQAKARRATTDVGAAERLPSTAMSSPFSPIADYAFLANCHTRGPGRPRRRGGLAVCAPVRLPECVRGAAGP